MLLKYLEWYDPSHGFAETYRIYLEVRERQLIDDNDDSFQRTGFAAFM